MLIGKVDIVSVEENVGGNTRTLFCIMNFTADTSERIGEINHPWHIKPPSGRSTPQLKSLEELGVDFDFKHLYK